MRLLRFANHSAIREALAGLNDELGRRNSFHDDSEMAVCEPDQRK